MSVQASSQSDIDEIESLFQHNQTSSASPSPLQIPGSVPPARPPSPPRASIPITPSGSSSYLPIPPVNPSPPKLSSPPNPKPNVSSDPSSAVPNFGSNAPLGFGGGPNASTLTEPVWHTVKRDLARVAANLRLVVFPNPYREDPGRALRDWDLWGPFFFIVFLGIAVSYSASSDNVSFFFFICFDRPFVLLHCHPWNVRITFCFRR